MHENVIGITSRGRQGDLRQAQYYQALLDELRTHTSLELTGFRLALERRRKNGALNTTRLQQLIAAKQAELITLDRLIDALSERFPTSMDLIADDDDAQSSNPADIQHPHHPNLSRAGGG